MTIEIPLTLTLSRQGREDKKRRLPRPDNSGLAMTMGEGVAMTTGGGADDPASLVLLSKIMVKHGIIAEARTSECSEGATF
jgi:hypothetical protein